MEKFENYSEIIKNNLIYYRKKAGWTQAELAERLHYSDKSISKWERGEGVPDIHVFIELAKLYGLTVNDFLSKAKKEKVVNRYFSKVMITAMAMIATYFLVVLAFFVLSILIPDGIESWPFWLLFIYGVPLTCVTLVVFINVYFKKMLANAIAISIMIWTTALSIYLSLPTVNYIHLIFILCIPAELIVILLFTLMRSLMKRKKA